MRPRRSRCGWRAVLGAAIACHAAGAAAAEPPSDAAATAALEQALGVSGDAPRRAAFAALIEYRCRPARVDERCLALLESAAADGDWRIRLAALPYAVRADLPSERCRPMARRAALRDANDAVRRAAAKLLSDQAVAGDREVFTALLQSDDALAREFAAGGLARLGDRGQVEVLRRDLRSADSELALEAARLLAAVDQQRTGDVAEVLRGSLDNADEIVRANALYVLSEMPVRARSEAEVTRALSDPSALVRGAALAVLPDMTLTAPGWPLAILAQRWEAEQSAELRLEILNAIGELGRRGAAPATDVEHFAEVVVRHERDDRLRTAAEGVLAEYDAAAALRLLALAGDPAAELVRRLLAMAYLGRSCQAQVLAPLGRLVEEPGGAAGGREALRVGAAAAWLRLVTGLADAHCSAKARAT